MRRVMMLLVPIAATLVGYQFLRHYRIDGLDSVQLAPRDPSAPGLGVGFGPGVGGDGVIRIASFNIQAFGEKKLSHPPVVGVLVEIVRRFDLVAVQEIRSQQQTLLPRFVAAINSTGADYDYVIGPRLGRSDSKEQYAYIFNRQTIEVDRDSIYTVYDPDDLLHREPLVAGFRARGAPPDAAFTFTLVNVHTDPDEVRTEINVLDDVYRAVRDDGRGEDDVILLGDLNANDRQFDDLSRLAGITWVISGYPTMVRGNAQYDNLLFDRRATTEFTGGGGVMDFLREFNLTSDEALNVSDHFPVWAEFSVVEGGQPGRVATQPAARR